MSHVQVFIVTHVNKFFVRNGAFMLTVHLTASCDEINVIWYGVSHGRD